MLFCTLLSFVVAAFAPLIVASPHPNKGALVNLRVEGQDKTIYEGFVFTRGHDVETASGGRHHCDGTNLGANPVPGPTCTSALDTAARTQGFAWDGTFFASFDDYLITSVGGEAATSNQFWGYFVNYRTLAVGGCQQQVEHLDEVLLAFDAFNKVHLLKLSGPQLVHAHQAATFTVKDGATGNPVAGADVNGHTSDTNGHISIVFDKIGVNGIKAQKPDSIRSNNLKVLVIA